ALRDVDVHAPNLPRSLAQLALGDALADQRRARALDLLTSLDGRAPAARRARRARGRALVPGALPESLALRARSLGDVRARLPAPAADRDDHLALVPARLPDAAPEVGDALLAPLRLDLPVRARVLAVDARLESLGLRLGVVPSAAHAA